MPARRPYALPTAAAVGFRLALVSTLVSCSGTDSDVLPDVVVSDSAGVSVVRVSPFGSFAVPEWTVDRVSSTSNVGGSPVELFQVADAVLQGDSALVIANAGSYELIFIDWHAGSVSRVGGQGDGPGEFGYLRRLLPHPSGDLVAFDYRLSRFDADGRFLSTRRLDAENRLVSLRPLAVFEDGTTVSVLGEQRLFQTEGERRDTVPLMVFRPGTSAPDTIGTWLGLESAFASVAGGQLIVPIGFARTTFAASNGRVVAIGSTDSLDITVYSESLEPTLRVIAARERRIPSARAVDRWLDRVLDNIPTDAPDARRAWSEAPIRESYPGFDGLILDNHDRLWIGEYPEPGADSRRWIVFSSDGRPEGQVHLPLLPANRLPGVTEILTVTDDQVVLLRKNRFDEETVEVWQVSPSR